MAQLSACGYVSHKEFEKLDIRVATIKAAKKHETKQVYVLSLDLGVEGKDCEAVVDLGKKYKIEKLVGKQCVTIVNIEPETVSGVEGTAMILAAAGADGKISLLKPDKKMVPGRPVVGVMSTVCARLG